MPSELYKIAKRLATKENKLKEYKKRVNAKGTVLKTSLTKNDNIRVEIKTKDDKLKFIVVKTHKERFATASTLKKDDEISFQAIRRFRTMICTKLTLKTKKPSEKLDDFL